MRSGITPLIYQRHGHDYVVASNGGGDPPGCRWQVSIDLRLATSGDVVPSRPRAAGVLLAARREGRAPARSAWENPSEWGLRRH